MTILALEFSSPQRSVAVVRRGAGTASFVASEVVETGAGGTRALGMVEDALRVAGLEREQIDVIAVGLGPGSYTGIRVALSLAQGWQLASPDGGVKLLGLSSAECVAAQAQAENISGRVGVVIDAQRNEFYLAAYEISADGWREIEPLRILTRVEVESRAGAKEILIGPEVTRWFPDGRMVFPRAAMLGQLALNRNDFAAGDKLEPIYLRETNFVKAPPGRRIAT
ncbi:MAG: tRNA (adenosine(37)-N6)-threonylcarbamoyltransferase complex dimerization subunit type 1 TsaB [Verrucomicrobiota bacterium]|jgi:tRNA threonylcarbamoyladenosine biosynthesis protein TsaB